MSNKTTKETSKNTSLTNNISEELLTELELRIEENEFFDYLHEQGIDAEQLTEEELDELFGFGTVRRTSRDAVKDSREASKGRRDKRETRQKAQDSRQRRKQARMDRVSKFKLNKPSAEPQAAEPQAATEPTNTGTAHTGGFKIKQGGEAAAGSGKPQGGRLYKGPSRNVRMPRKLAQSTEIVRNSRIALAERVLATLKKNISETDQDVQTKSLSPQQRKLAQERAARLRNRAEQAADQQKHARAGTLDQRKGTRKVETATPLVKTPEFKNPNVAAAKADTERKELIKVRAKGMPGGGKYPSTRPKVDRAKVFGREAINIEILKNKDKTDKTRDAATAKLDAARKRRGKERKEKGEPALYSDRSEEHKMAEGAKDGWGGEKKFLQKFQNDQRAKTKMDRAKAAGSVVAPEVAAARRATYLRRQQNASTKGLSELSRSEKFDLDYTDTTKKDIKAERAKRRKADPKAQRYMARRVPKPRGQEPDNPAAGHNRRLAGTRAAEKTKNKEYADAKAAGKVTKVMQASTEILKKGRMALAEKVLSELSQGTLEKYRAKAMSQDPTTTPLKREKGISKASTKIARHKQGKSTPKSMFGGKSNQTSTTAGGGTLGSQLAKVKPETQHSMNRRGTSTADKKKVAANLADAKSGRNTASLAKEIAADNAKRAAAKRAEG